MVWPGSLSECLVECAGLFCCLTASAGGSGGGGEGRRGAGRDTDPLLMWTLESRL